MEEACLSWERRASPVLSQECFTVESSASEVVAPWLDRVSQHIVFWKATVVEELSTPSAKCAGVLPDPLAHCMEWRTKMIS